jgi:hypothetical protein
MSDRRQEWFDTIVRGMHTQHWERALNEGSVSCAYRAEHGRKCGVGHLLDDDKAAEAIAKNYTVLVLHNQHNLEKLGLGDISDIEYKFLLKVQEAHDGAYMPHEVKDNFIRLYQELDLVWPKDVP